MRWWIVLLIFAGLGYGFYKRWLVLDPLSIVNLVMLVWTQWASTGRQQQLADLIGEAHKVQAQNLKVVLSHIDQMKVEVKRSRT